MKRAQRAIGAGKATARTTARMTATGGRATVFVATCVVVLVVGLVGAMGERAAGAQTLELPRGRQGYYQALGFNFDAAEEWDHGDAAGPALGGLLTLRWGQMLTPRWGLGLRGELGDGRADGHGHLTGGVAIEAQLNPVGDLALFAAVGLGGASVSYPRDAEHPTRGGSGSLYEIGVSRDIFLTHRLTGGWSLVPTATLRYLPSESWHALWLCVGIQISRWTGRPRNELILPEADAYERRR